MNETPSLPILSDPPRPWRSRWHSAMKRGLLAVLAATAAEIVLAGLAMEFGKRFSFLFLVVPPCLILAGFVWGAIRPRRYANGPASPHTGCLVGLLVPAFILFGFGWMVSAFFVAMPHEPIERSAEVYDPAESWDGFPGKNIRRFLRQCYIADKMRRIKRHVEGGGGRRTRSIGS